MVNFVIFNFAMQVVFSCLFCTTISIDLRAKLVLLGEMGIFIHSFHDPFVSYSFVLIDSILVEKSYFT